LNEIKADRLNLNRLEKLLEFEIPRDIEVPEVATLRQAVQQAKWVDDVHTRLVPGTLTSIDIDKVRQLIEAGSGLGHHVSCEHAMSELQQLLFASDACEQKALESLSARPPHDMVKLKAIIEESKMFSLSLPSVVALTEAIKAAKNWTSQVEGLLADSKPPSLETVESLIAKGQQIPVLLEPLSELETRSAAARAWLERTSKSILLKKSHLLLETLSPRCDITKYNDGGDVPASVTFTDQTTSLASLRQAGQRELNAMLKLRELNQHKTDQSGTTYCLCKRVRSGTMVLCQLCCDLFHADCVSYKEPTPRLPRAAGESASRATRSKLQTDIAAVDMQPYFCPLCVRSRRPSFADLLSALVALQKLTVWLPEGIAIQLLADRAIRWLEEVRLVLSSDEVALLKANPQEAVADKSVHLSFDKSSSSAASKTRQLLEKTIVTLDKLMVEGDLLEVTIDEKNMLRDILRSCRPTDYSQIVYGFPDVLVNCMEGSAKRDGIARVKRKNSLPERKFDKVSRKKKQTQNKDIVEENSEELCSAQSCLRPSGDEVAWVQCDKCQLWFHFRCIGVDTISEQDEYICTYCSKQESTEMLQKQSQPSTSTAAVKSLEVESDSDSEDDQEDEDDEDDHMKEFYANEYIEPIDSYIIRTKNKFSPPHTAAGKLDDVIVLE
jgi:histone demethylase JARID1